MKKWNEVMRMRTRKEKKNDVRTSPGVYGPPKKHLRSFFFSILHMPYAEKTPKNEIKKLPKNYI
jgi:hypothetical protein